MQHDEWEEKAQEIAGGIINPDSVMRYTSKQDAGEWIANLARLIEERRLAGPATVLSTMPRIADDIAEMLRRA